LGSILGRNSPAFGFREQALGRVPLKVFFSHDFIYIENRKYKSIFSGAALGCRPAKIYEIRLTSFRYYFVSKVSLINARIICANNIIKRKYCSAKNWAIKKQVARLKISRE